jgi:hypothetical protein
MKELLGLQPVQNLVQWQGWPPESVRQSLLALSPLKAADGSIL